MASNFQKWRVSIFNFFAFLLLVFISISDSIWDEEKPFVAALLFSVGILLVGVASLGRLWCSLYIAGHKTQILVTEGPYSISRNPLYFFSFIGFLGIGLCTETLLIPALLLGAFILYSPIVIRQEETKLRKIHGETFEKYAISTPVFFPSLSKLREPESYVVNPKLFRKHIFWTLFFVWCVAIFEIIEEVHALGWIPFIVRIY